jgi:hypothetical protein
MQRWERAGGPPAAGPVSQAVASPGAGNPGAGGPGAPSQAEAVRDFTLHLDRTLTVRRLYSPHAGHYQEAMQTLRRKLAAALELDGFALRVTPTRLMLGAETMLERPQRDDSFFFPFYRDGLRELAFTPELALEDLEPLLGAFEAERQRRLAPDEDLVAYLWRCDLDGIRFAAVDGIGEEEAGEEASPGGDYGALVRDLVERIRDPAPPTTGQSYAFVLDADVRLQATDLRYDPTTTRRAFAENPTVFPLTRAQADALRGEVSRDDEADLLSRFVEILLAMALDAGRGVPLAQVLGVLRQLVGGLWQVGEHAALARTLTRLRAAADEAPDPATRAALAETLRGFFTPERMRELVGLAQGGDGEGVAFALARELWDSAGEEAWMSLLDCVMAPPDGELAGELRRYLRGRLASAPELMRRALGDAVVERVLAALSLLDPRVEGVFARELLSLVGHREEAVRLKALAVAGRLGGADANEALWRAVQGDPSYQVRLLAFRLLAASDRAGLISRLTALASDQAFGERPLFERRKVAQMLAAALGEEAAPLFLRWLPERRRFLARHLLTREQLETVGLVTEMLRECGAAGHAALETLAVERGKAARLARAALGRSGRRRR